MLDRILTYGLIGLAMGVFLAAVAVRAFRRAHVPAGWIRVPGIVIADGSADFHDKHPDDTLGLWSLFYRVTHGFRPTVRFATREGRAIVWTQGFGRSFYKQRVETRIDMRYDPAVPEQARVDRTGPDLVGCLFAVVCVPFIGIGTWLTCFALLGMRIMGMFAGPFGLAEPGRPVEPANLEPAGITTGDPTSDAPAADEPAADEPTPDAPPEAPAPAAPPTAARSLVPLSPVDSAAWIVGDGGTILRCDAGRCETIPSGVTTGLLGISGSGPKDIWAVGTEGILHFDGSEWKVAMKSHPSRMTAVWSRAADDAWATNDGGRIWHWDGSAWTMQHEVPGGPSFTRITGFGPSQVWALASPGVRTFQWDGRAWSERQAFPGKSSEALVAASPTDVWMGRGAELWSWTGSAWAREAPRDDFGPGTFAASSIMATRSDELWACGAGEIRRRVKGRWSVMTPPPLKPRDARLLVMERGRDGAVWVAGSDGNLLLHRGETWTAVLSGTAKNLYGIWVQ